MSTRFSRTRHANWPLTHSSLASARMCAFSCTNLIYLMAIARRSDALRRSWRAENRKERENQCSKWKQKITAKAAAQTVGALDEFAAILARNGGARTGVSVAYASESVARDAWICTFQEAR